MKDINYLAIQKDILENLYKNHNKPDTVSMPCYDIVDGELVISNGYYGVKINRESVFVKLKTTFEMESIFEDQYKNNYYRVYAAIPCEYKKYKLFRLIAGDEKTQYTTYVLRKYYNLFGEIAVYITDNRIKPVLFFNSNLDCVGFLLPISVLDDNEVLTYAEE